MPAEILRVFGGFLRFTIRLRSDLHDLIYTIGLT